MARYTFAPAPASSRIRTGMIAPAILALAVTCSSTAGADDGIDQAGAIALVSMPSIGLAVVGGAMGIAGAVNFGDPPEPDTSWELNGYVAGGTNLTAAALNIILATQIVEPQDTTVDEYFYGLAATNGAVSVLNFAVAIAYSVQCSTQDDSGPGETPAEVVLRPGGGTIVDIAGRGAPLLSLSGQF